MRGEGYGFDVGLIMPLIHQIIFNDPTKDCKMRGKKENWLGLPKSKSLFFAGENKGLPIGNLTSQLFGNVYLNEFDHFVKYKLGCKYYGRYVDDIVIVHKDKEYLKSIIPAIKKYLKDELCLRLHPNKIYLQHFSKGISFIGALIKPYRVYVRNKTKGNFYQKIQQWNKIFLAKSGKLEKKDIEKVLASTNSYLGMLKHYNTYKLRRKMMSDHFLPHFRKFFYISCDYAKIFRKHGA